MLSDKELLLEQLLLRTPRLEDAATIFERYAKDPEVTRYMSWSPHGCVRETEEFLERVARDWKEGHACQWVITLREPLEDVEAPWIPGGVGRVAADTAIGMIGTLATDQPHKVEIGYVLARAFWGRGYMTEALRAVIDTALSDLECMRVFARCDVENIASARVMEKAGMEREGILRADLKCPNRSPQVRDALLYSLVRPIPIEEE